jgi:hypothetical protein
LLIATQLALSLIEDGDRIATGPFCFACLPCRQPAIAGTRRRWQSFFSVEGGLQDASQSLFSMEGGLQDVKCMIGVEYISRIPASVPAGKVLVHNHVRWSQRARPSRRGFRAWLDRPRPYHVQCQCDWARHLHKHYIEERA